MAIDRGRLELHFETERFIFRSVTLDDASSRWAGWLNDPVAARMLNARPQSLTMEQLRNYIGTFDQATRLLLGIFDKQTGAHIGMAALNIVDGGRKILPAILIGEAEYRKLGAITEIAVAVRGYFFDTLGFEAAVVHVLAYNRLVIAMLEHRGWSLIDTLPGEKISARTGEKIDLLVYELTRDAWRGMQKQAAQSGEARQR